MGKTKYQPSKKARLESRYKKNVNPKKADRLNEGDKARRKKSIKSAVKKAGSMLGRAVSPPKTNIIGTLKNIRDRKSILNKKKS